MTILKLYLQSSWSVSSVFHLFLKIIDLLIGLVTALLLTDGAQRKRKDDGELEGKPAKRKSATNEDDSQSVSGAVDDVTATALQNLQLAKHPPEVPGTPSGLVPTTGQPLSDSGATDAMSLKQASNTGYQPTGRANCIIMRDRIVLWGQ